MTAAIFKRAYKYRLSPSKKQREKLQWTLDQCRELYNASLQERRDAYEIAVRRHPNFYDEETRKQLARAHAISYEQQTGQLPAIKELREEYALIHSQVQQETLRRVKKAFDGFFRRVKEGKTPGYPRFNLFDSFCYPQSGFSLTEDHRVCLSKIGTIKVKKATWFQTPQESWEAGWERASQGRQPAKRFSPQRVKETGHQIQTIFFEKLAPANMSRRPKPKQGAETGEYVPNGATAKAGLNKSIRDAGWAQFVQHCQNKAEEAGSRVLLVDPKYTSQRCSNCGAIKKKTLEERWHSCPCGADLARDHNSALDILHLGLAGKTIPKKQPRRTSTSTMRSSTSGIPSEIVPIIQKARKLNASPRRQYPPTRRPIVRREAVVINPPVRATKPRSLQLAFRVGLLILVAALALFLIQTIVAHSTNPDVRFLPVSSTVSTPESSPQNQAVATVQQYYADWNTKNYQAAYDLLQASYQQRYPFSSLLPDYQQAHHVCITITSTKLLQDGTVQVAVSANVIEDAPSGGTVISLYYVVFNVNQVQDSWKLAPISLQRDTKAGVCSG